MVAKEAHFYDNTSHSALQPCREPRRAMIQMPSCWGRHCDRRVPRRNWIGPIEPGRGWRNLQPRFIIWIHFARVHQTLRCTPAIEAQVTDRRWPLEDIVRIVDEWELFGRKAHDRSWGSDGTFRAELGRLGCSVRGYNRSSDPLCSRAFDL